MVMALEKTEHVDTAAMATSCSTDIAYAVQMEKYMITPPTIVNVAQEQ